MTLTAVVESTFPAATPLPAEPPPKEDRAVPAKLAERERLYQRALALGMEPRRAVRILAYGNCAAQTQTGIFEYEDFIQAMERRADASPTPGWSLP